MWAVRRLLEHLARERPLVIAFDDLQWAEPTFLDLIEYLLGWIRDAPILIVCMARPELLEQHPGWLGAAPSASSIVLDPLSEPEAEALLELLSGETELTADLLRADHGGRRGQPALRRADARDADRERRRPRTTSRFRRRSTLSWPPASTASSPRSGP